MSKGEAKMGTGGSVSNGGLGLDHRAKGPISNARLQLLSPAKIRKNQSFFGGLY